MRRVISSALIFFVVITGYLLKKYRVCQRDIVAFHPFFSNTMPEIYEYVPENTTAH